MLQFSAFTRLNKLSFLFFIPAQLFPTITTLFLCFDFPFPLLIFFAPDPTADPEGDPTVGPEGDPTAGRVHVPIDSWDFSGGPSCLKKQVRLGKMTED